MIKINNVSKSFLTQDGTFEALKNISLTIKDNSCTVIAGENGSGKSLLMSVIAGLEAPDSGSVECDKKPGLVFQEAETQILGETPEEDIAFGPSNLGFSKSMTDQMVNSALEITALKEKKDFPARFLSGGEKRRLAIACMIAMDFSTIILDEPYANLDYTGVKQVNSLIKKLKSENKTVIILTHELEKCLALADDFVVLFRGKIVYHDTPQNALKENLEKWNIRNPLNSYKKLEDLVW
ncbi:MAG: energy-coupling factor ABC transporter ATP-binding protein [Treponema sp.]|uniref:energy-coupling factor ABC transporter ATP-binding protein n=1 Tax=Treponema sp. TaxID=166 RepID=UPI00298D6792|nr:ABC transporter ATP-binding protein [Treponema sp.]MCR5386049.1 energy-coupling factor ABC transporter ATP-binding protein [Treponema sp.]